LESPICSVSLNSSTLSPVGRPLLLRIPLLYTQAGEETTSTQTEPHRQQIQALFPDR
jgi:hypothetical protein